MTDICEFVTMWVEVEESGSPLGGLHHAMYCGEVYTVLDDKNRITVPSKFRKTMDDLEHTEFFMCRGYDGCLFIFPKQEWDNISRESRRYASLDARAVDLRRLLFGSVQEVAPDAQGRIPVPEHLRSYACLDKEAALVGADDHIELWNRSGWREYQRKREVEFRDIVSNYFTTGPATLGGATGALVKVGEAVGDE